MRITHLLVNQPWNFQEDVYHRRCNATK